MASLQDTYGFYFRSKRTSEDILQPGQMVWLEHQRFDATTKKNPPQMLPRYKIIQYLGGTGFHAQYLIARDDNDQEYHKNDSKPRLNWTRDDLLPLYKVNGEPLMKGDIDTNATSLC
ncbi:hypothetical protein N7G274_007073 [Stereocaulon virgatum]|uniref:Uncharacterized protein n=1 Tax=Stereocaulon virgatum TaxID=373712 RepID=A0ABR4A527_9LECA